MKARIVGFALAIMVMGIYAIWVNRQVKQYRSADDYANSIYYLGFLLTMVSLASSVLTGISDRDDLINLFAIGLTTTILGLGGKLYFSQFRQLRDEDLEE